MKNSTLMNHPVLSGRKPARWSVGVSAYGSMGVMKKILINHALSVINIILIFACGAGYGATNYYVWKDNPDPVKPYTNWAMAATNIQLAVDLTINGDTVYVTNGTYDTGGAITPGKLLANRVCVNNKTITIRSERGPDFTIIKGKPDEATGACGDAAVRCVYLKGRASLIGFTLTNGYTMTNCNEFYDQCGGGVFLDNVNTVVSNCVLSGNTAKNYGGGACLYWAGTMNNCMVAGNISKGWSGGGVFLYKGGVVNNCTLSGNRAPAGIGGGAMLHGEQYSEINGCVVVSNTANSGGGVYLYYGGAIINCTVVSNTATGDGGGVWCRQVGSLTNCVVWGNKSSGTSSNFYQANPCIISYTCSGPKQTGDGNIDADPLFMDADRGNYRLAANSPCINAGTNFSWMADPADVRSKDLDGRMRIRYGTVDMGAYERIKEGIIHIVH